MESHPGDEPLRCEVTPVLPALNFSFRVQAGYTFHVPQTQYPGSTSGWAALTAITPDGGEATYLLARTRLADASRTGLNFDVRGLYFLGAGHYSVESILRDDRNRVCRKEWQISVEPARAVPAALPPGAVRQFSPVISPDTQHPDSAPPMRLSVLLNAAALSPFRTVIRSFDRSVLLGALTALLEHLPAASVRLVVFSLEQQKEVYRAENFSHPDIGKVAGAIRSFEQATVDVHVLEKPLGYVDFLAGLIARERDAPDPPDTIVFLGPTSRYGDKIPEGALPAPGEKNPRFFYLRYESPRRGVSAPAPVQASAPPASGADPALNGVYAPTLPPGITPTAPSPVPRPPPADNLSTGNRGRGSTTAATVSQTVEGQSDVITAAIGRLKGKTLNIHTPADLAKAIRKIEGKR
jgi:hypothetical protein